MKKKEKGEIVRAIRVSGFMRIDILVSVLSESKKLIEAAVEEIEIKNAIGKLLSEKGYKKFTIAGGEMIDEKLKKKNSFEKERKNPTMRKFNLGDIVRYKDKLYEIVRVDTSVETGYDFTITGDEFDSEILARQEDLILVCSKKDRKDLN